MDYENGRPIGALSKAMAKAQKAFAHAGKKTDNEAVGSKYADLAAVIDAIRTPLGENGLWFTQPTDVLEDGRVKVETIIWHDSGEFMMAGRVTLRPMTDGPQATGSALTYARRYSLSAAFGIAAIGDDDDGNAAQGRTGAQGPARAHQGPTGPQVAPAPDPKPAEGLRSTMADEKPDASKPKLEPAKVRGVLEATPRRTSGAAIRADLKRLLAVLLSDDARLRTLQGAWKQAKLTGDAPSTLEGFDAPNDATLALLYAAIRDRLAKYADYEEKPEAGDEKGAAASGGGPGVPSGGKGGAKPRPAQEKGPETPAGSFDAEAKRIADEAAKVADDAIDSFLRE